MPNRRSAIKDENNGSPRCIGVVLVYAEMITDPEALEQFENELIRNTPVDYFKNLEILEAMYEEAVALGVFPLADPLDGIETDIKLARAINSV